DCRGRLVAGPPPSVASRGPWRRLADRGGDRARRGGLLRVRARIRAVPPDLLPRRQLSVRSAHQPPRAALSLRVLAGRVGAPGTERDRAGWPGVVVCPRPGTRDGGGRGMTGRGFKLVTIAGIRIIVHPSWFIIFALVVATLASVGSVATGGHLPTVPR